MISARREVRFNDAAFSAFAAARGVAVADLGADESFIPALFGTIRKRLEAYPISGDAPARPLALGVLDRPSPNAFAVSHLAGICVGIHTGLLASIVEAAAMFRDALGVFSADFGRIGLDPGSPSAEPVGLKTYLSFMALGDFDPMLLGRPSDTDSPETLRGAYFISCALHFAVLHEFGHVVNGHLGWLEERGLTPWLEEVDDVDYGNNLTQQLDMVRFFEHEADVWALQVLIRSAVEGQDIGAIEGVAPPERLVLLILGFLTLVFTWVMLENQPGVRASGRHPAGTDRLLALPMALMGVLETAPHLAGAVQDGLRRSRVIVTALAQRLPLFAPMQEVFLSDGVDRADRIAQWMREMDRSR